MFKKLILTSIISISLNLPALSQPPYPIIEIGDQKISFSQPGDFPSNPHSGAQCTATVIDKLCELDEFGNCIPYPLYIPDYSGTRFRGYTLCMITGVDLVTSGEYNDIEQLKMAKTLFKKAMDIAITIQAFDNNSATYETAERAYKAVNNTLYAAENNGLPYLEWAKIVGESNTSD